MLTSRSVLAVTVALLLTTTGGVSQAEPATPTPTPSTTSARQDPVTCPAGQVKNLNGMCELAVRTEGKEETGSTEKAPDGSTRPASQPAGAATAKPVCRRDEKVIPCVQDGAWWSASNNCYVGAVDPPPAKTDPVWEGNTGGAVYS